jgi:hypothetical protein
MQTESFGCAETARSEEHNGKVPAIFSRFPFPGKTTGKRPDKFVQTALFAGNTPFYVELLPVFRNVAARRAN